MKLQKRSRIGVDGVKPAEKIARMGDAPSRGARHFREPRRQGKPASVADHPQRRHDTRPDLRPIFQSQGTPRQPGHQIVWRRAADAGDCAHPAHWRALPSAGRADRGSRAGHHPADRKDNRAAEGRSLTSLLVEQNFRFASTVADRFDIVEHGKIIDTFANSEL